MGKTTNNLTRREWRVGRRSREGKKRGKEGRKERGKEGRREVLFHDGAEVLKHKADEDSSDRSESNTDNRQWPLGAPIYEKHNELRKEVKK